MLRLKINQGTWYDNETMLRPHKLAEYEHILKAVVPFQGYGVTYHSFPLTIGREPSNHVVLDHGTVSRKHAVVTEEGDDYFIRDLGSKAEIRVCDKAGKKKDGLEGKIQLCTGDLITLGETSLEVLQPKEVF